MNQEHPQERDLLQQQLGARDERLRQLEQRAIDQHSRWESDATEWQLLQRHRNDLAEWLIDSATNEAGKLIKTVVEAGLGGEAFVPCSFTATTNGRRYRLDLASTEYEIKEVTGNG